MILTIALVQLHNLIFMSGLLTSVNRISWFIFDRLGFDLPGPKDEKKFRFKAFVFWFLILISFLC